MPRTRAQAVGELGVQSSVLDWPSSVPECRDPELSEWSPDFVSLELPWSSTFGVVATVSGTLGPVFATDSVVFACSCESSTFGDPARFPWTASG